MDPSTIDRCLSSERFDGFLVESRGDVDLALQLYIWNVDLSASFFKQLALLEVGLRNTCHQTLAATQPGDRGIPWYLDRDRLQKGAIGQVNVVRERIHSEGKIESPGRVVAGLTFAFWRGLVDSKNETLWIRALHRAFPDGDGLRRSIAVPLTRLHPFRNRLAHHEPIHRLPITVLRKRLEEIDEVGGAIGTSFGLWLRANRSDLSYIIDNRPS